MKFISAERIHNGHHWLPSNSIIEVDDEGTIKGIHPPETIPKEKIQFYPHIITPGFVNVHCHTELSHLRNAIPQNTGLVSFLTQVPALRGNYSQEQKQEAMNAAIAEMHTNGIVAVGDIANSGDMVTPRLNAPLHFHTFVETMGVVSSGAAARFEWSVKVFNEFESSASPKSLIRNQSIVPHAPYSVSPQLFHLINNFLPNAVLTIHNEESLAENELFENGTGAMLNLYAALNIDPSHFSPSGKTSVQTYYPYFSTSHALILVHNTCITTADITFLSEKEKPPYLCLCPNANWYIERKVPPVDMIAKSNLPICLGTDSLASNTQLSIWSEILTLQSHFPTIDISHLITWGTFNGARALGMDPLLGSIEIGKKPGILHIDNKNVVHRLI